MIKIRRTFETNSSSAHTLVISDNDICHSFSDLGHFTFENGKKIFHVSGGDSAFGWNWLVYADAPSKANYLYLDGNQERLISIIKNFTQADEVMFDDILEENSARYGAYIDHQSRGTSYKVFSMTDKEIWRFIMNDSAIRTGNDNSDGPWEIYDESAD